MDEKNDIIERIFGQADVVEVTQEPAPVDVAERPEVIGLSKDTLAFAPLEEMAPLLTYFNQNPNEFALDNQNVEMLRFIYEKAKTSGDPYSHIIDIGSRLGGRMQPGILNKIYSYMAIQDEESQLVNRLTTLDRERNSLIN